MTGPEALTALENMGVTFRPAPDGRLMARLPERFPPDARVLLDDVRRDRGEALRLLAARTPAVPTVPGREAARPCLRCGTECREEELFCTEVCFSTWKAARRERRGATMPATARTATGPAPSTPSPRGAA